MLYINKYVTFSFNHSFSFHQEISVSGKLEVITLVNFLCHSHLEVPLGPNVNFIIGKNGSKFKNSQGNSSLCCKRTLRFDKLNVIYKVTKDYSDENL